MRQLRTFSAPIPAGYLHTLQFCVSSANAPICLYPLKRIYCHLLFYGLAFIYLFSDSQGTTMLGSSWITEILVRQVDKERTTRMHTCFMTHVSASFHCSGNTHSPAEKTSHKADRAKTTQPEPTNKPHHSVNTAPKQHRGTSCLSFQYL